MCVCIAALTVAFLQAATDRKIKFKLHQLPPRYRQQMQTQKQLLCLQQKTTQNPTDSTKSNKDKKDRNNSEDKKNSKDNSQNSNGSAVEKSEKSEQSSNNSSSDKKNRLLHQTVLQSRTKRMMFNRQRRTSTKPILYRRENQNRLNRKNRKRKIQIFIVPLQSPVQQFLTI